MDQTIVTGNKSSAVALRQNLAIFFIEMFKTDTKKEIMSKQTHKYAKCADMIKINPKKLPLLNVY